MKLTDWLCIRGNYRSELMYPGNFTSARLIETADAEHGHCIGYKLSIDLDLHIIAIEFEQTSGDGYISNRALKLRPEKDDWDSFIRGNSEINFPGLNNEDKKKASEKATSMILHAKAMIKEWEK